MKYICEQNRVFAEDENGDFRAEVTFPEYQEGVVVIAYTYVDPCLRGQGIASELLRNAYTQIKECGKKARPTCPYAISWFKRHPETHDILIV